MKIKINIPGFGERYCSNNFEYKLLNDRDSYKFFKKGTHIFHNEYGPSVEWKDGSYVYLVNDNYHRLNSCSNYNTILQIKTYYVIGKFLGNKEIDFIKKLANTLIPNEEYFL